MPEITNAQIIAQELYKAGIRYVFGHPGGEVVDLIEALAQAGIEFVLMGHESAAALAAGILGHATGIPGVCLATLGPGASNLTLGIAEAWLERHPMLALSARTPDEKTWFNHQHLPLNELFAPITKESIELTDHACDEQIRYALEAALTPPRGPVYLSLPGDVAASEPDPNGVISQTIYFSASPEFENLDPIAEALNRAKRPVVVVGIALDQRQDAPSVREFLATTGLPYADTPKTKGLVDPDGMGYLGSFLSSSASSILNQVIRESDCILGVGYDPVESTYDWHLGENYYAITHASTAFGSFWSHNEATGDVSELLKRLQEQFDGISEWKPEEFADIRHKVAAAITPEVDTSERGLAPLAVARALQTYLPANTQLVVDTGQHKMLFAQAWRTNTPLSYFASNGLSSMGVALPGAIALAVHDRARPVVAVIGDGSFNMVVQELETVNRLGIRPLIVVMCDQALSLIRIPQQMRGYPSRGVDFAPVDWALVANGYGVRGEWIHTLSELGSAILKWIRSPQAMVLAVRIDESLYRGNEY